LAIVAAVPGGKGSFSACAWEAKKIAGKAKAQSIAQTRTALVSRAMRRLKGPMDEPAAKQ
jgi:hypothetical protein